MDKRAVMPSAERKKSGFFYGYVMILAAFFIMLIYGGMIYTFGVFFKPLLAEFGWTRATVSGAYSLYMILHGLLFIVTGRLNDRFGARIVTTLCGFFLGLGYLLMSKVESTWHLYLFYGVIIAMGMSGGAVPVMSTIARWFVKKRGLVTGIVLSGVGVGTIIIPPLASQLISAHGWRTSYIIIGSIALVLTVGAAQFLRRDPRQIGQLPYGEIEAREESSISDLKGFSLHEAVRTRQLWMLCVILFLFGFGEHAVMVHIVPHATDLGISPVLAANILAVIGGLSIAGRVGLGNAADKIGNKGGLIVSFIVFSFALFWLLVAKELWTLYLFAVAFGFGYGALITMASPIVAELFGLRAHGAILGVVIFAQTIGSALGPTMTGRIFDVTSSYQLAFVVSAGLSVGGLVLTLLLRPTRKEYLL